MRLNKRNAIVTRTLPDGCILDLFPLVGARVRLTVSEDERASGYLEGW